MDTTVKYIHDATCPHYNDKTGKSCNAKYEFSKEDYEKLQVTGSNEAPLREIPCKECGKTFYDPATLKIFD